MSQGKRNPVETITVDELRDHVFYLASDSLQGRSTLTTSYNIAANYTRSQFYQAGLEPLCRDSAGNTTYFQQVLLGQYELDKINSKLTINIEDANYPFEVLDHFIIYSGAPFDQNVVNGQAVFVGYGINEPDFGWDDYQGIELKGKWAIMMTPIPDSIMTKYLAKCPVQNLSDDARIKNAYKAGAIGVIALLSKEFLALFWNSAKNSSNKSYSIPRIGRPSLNCPIIVLDSTLNSLIFKEKQFDPLELIGEYGSFDLKGITIELKKEYHSDPIVSKNIVAVVSGTDPKFRDEYITVGAHLDHLGIANGSVYNGADDNASGSAAILEVAEAVVLSRPKRSVVFVLYAGEEMGLFGSYYFVKNAPVPIENIKVNINLDMIGRLEGDANELAIIGADRITPKLEEVIYEVNKNTLQLPLDSVDLNNFFERSDHYTFYLIGIPSVLFTTGEHVDYHQFGDDAEKIDYDFLQLVSKLSYEVIMKLANEDISLKN